MNGDRKGRARPLARAAGFALILGTLSVAGPPKVEIRGTHDDERFVTEARAAVRSAWVTFCAVSGTRPGKEDAYVVHVYRERDEYLKADRDLNGGRFANNGGFFSLETGEAHLLIAPRAEPEFTREVALTERMRELLVHEASHMFWRRHVYWYAGAPAWALEGAAEVCAEREIGGPGTSVYFGTGLQTLKRAAAAGRLVPLEDVLSIDMSARPEGFERDLYYREAWALVKWLMEEKPEAWRKLGEGFSGVEDPAHATGRGRTLFAKHVGEPRDVQKAWTAWFLALEGGPWEMRFGDWRLENGELEGVAYPKTGSVIFHEQELRGDAVVSADVFVHSLGSGQADLCFGAWDDRARNFLKLSFVKDGLTALLVQKDEVWERVAITHSDPPAVPAGEWRRVRVEIAGRTVRAFAGGKQVLEHAIADPDVRLDGRWGFGNFDSRSRFRNWSVETK